MSMRALALGWLLLLAMAPAAHAGTITIEFDLSNSTFSVLDGLISVPPDGSFPVARAEVRIPGYGISTPVGGPATLVSLVHSLTFDAAITYYGYQLTFVGNVFLQALKEAIGDLTPGLRLLSFNQPARASYRFFFDCDPKFLCNGGYYYFPYSNAGTVVSPPGSIQVGNLAQNGQATMRLVNTVTQSASVMIVGREVARSFVPEPSHTLRAFAAIGAVLGLSFWRRRPVRLPRRRLHRGDPSLACPGGLTPRDNQRSTS